MITITITVIHVLYLFIYLAIGIAISFFGLVWSGVRSPLAADVFYGAIVWPVFIIVVIAGMIFGFFEKILR